jgi:hypothetical protein
VERSSRDLRIRLVFLVIGVFGAAFAVSGVLIALPAPAAGGTCGPGQASEAPIVALFDPHSIGAGPEPATTNTAARDDWVAFVSECQASTDDRSIAAAIILLLSIGIAVVGPMLVLRRRRKPGDSIVPWVPTGTG